jgi:hypothetical protein
MRGRLRRPEPRGQNLQLHYTNGTAQNRGEAPSPSGASRPPTSPRAAGRGEKESRSRDALTRPSSAHHHHAIPKRFAPGKKGRRSAERRNPTIGRAASTSVAAHRCPGAAARPYLLLPRLRGRVREGARPPSGASPRLSPKRASACAQPRPRFTRTSGCGRYPHHQSRLSEAPRTPVIMPAGTMPGPPGSGSHSSARGHRTRSDFRKCPRERRPW